MKSTPRLVLCCDDDGKRFLTRVTEHASFLEAAVQVKVAFQVPAGQTTPDRNEADRRTETPRGASTRQIDEKARKPFGSGYDAYFSRAVMSA
jgi:hypothetical protein